MADPYQNPPIIKPKVEDGYIKLTPQEFTALMRWLESFKKYVEDNLP